MTLQVLWFYSSTGQWCFSLPYFECSGKKFFIVITIFSIEISTVFYDCEYNLSVKSVPQFSFFSKFTMMLI